MIPSSKATLSLAMVFVLGQMVPVSGAYQSPRAGEAPMCVTPVTSDFILASITADRLNQSDVAAMTLQATTHNDCATQADTQEYDAFHYDASTCTAYMFDNVLDPCTLQGDTDIYIRNSSIGAAGIVPSNYNMTLRRGLASIIVNWKNLITDQESGTSKFVLTWNGQSVTVNGSTFEHRFKGPGLCDDYPSDSLYQVTLEAMSDSDRPTAKTVTETLLYSPTFPGERRLLASGNCAYTHILGTMTGRVDYQQMVDFCWNSFRGTLFVAYKAGDMATFQSDMVTLLNASPSINLQTPYVGLRKVNDSYLWQSGLVQSINNTSEVEYVDGFPERVCAQADFFYGFKIFFWICEQKTNYLCHEHLPTFQTFKDSRITLG